MQTSYFAISHNLPNAVSVAAKSPDFYGGTEFLPLAPTWDIFSEYKHTKNTELFTVRYVEEILLPLNPQEIYDEFRYSVILCWESPGKFCHRRIIAKWLEDSLNVSIPEL